MSKLKKEEFNQKYRFRKPREEGLVTCISCATMTGGIEDKEGPAFCIHPQRRRKIKIAEYWEGWIGKGTSHNIASERVCDAYTSRPLPGGTEIPILNVGQGILLGTQWRDPYHADPNCPYVLEELRIIANRRKTVQEREGEISIIDISEMVPGQVVRDMCDMPCCEERLQFQIWNPNSYRTHVGIKPNSKDPRRWIRNRMVKHERKIKMSPQEAEAAFDLSRFNDTELGSVFKRINLVSDYLHKHTNRLGSRPLVEAVNPVWLDGHFHILEQSQVGDNNCVDVWVYDERLFNAKEGLKKTLEELERVPEGIIPCIDTNKVFKTAELSRPRCCKLSESFYIHGVLRPIEDQNLLSKGLRHLIEIGAVSYHGYEQMWGEFGKDFSEIASFHQQ